MNQNGTFATQALSTMSLPEARLAGTPFSEPRFSAARCRAQVLVLDSANGSADLVMSVAERLYEHQLCLFAVEQAADVPTLALRGVFHLAVVGITSARAQEAVALIACLSHYYPTLPVIAITDALLPLQLIDIQTQSHNAIVEVLPFPRHAAQLRVFVFDVLGRYLPL